MNGEFADVAVQADGAANGPRLRPEDRRTGRVRFLGALELQTVIWLPDSHLARLADSPADHWREA